MWEEKDVADRRLIAEEHHHAVDAVADAARWWHAVLKCADEVVIVLHGLLVTLALSLHLGSKALLLINGVVELGVCVCVLCATDNELKAVGQTRIICLAFGERRNLCRIIADKGWVYDALLAKLVVDLKQQLAGLPLWIPLNLIAVQDCAEFLDRGVNGELLASDLGRNLCQGRDAPVAGEVNLGALVGDDLVTLLATASL